MHGNKEPFDITRITLFVDDPEAWIVPWAQRLARELAGRWDVSLVHDPSGLGSGDVCFLLGCTKLLPAAHLARHRLNLVVHESDLPAGRGFSPVAWQVLAGSDTIPVVLFEATAKADAGPVYLRDEIRLRGDELLPEIRTLQGEMTLELVRRFLALWPDVTPVPQAGQASYSRKRTRADDELAVDKTLAEHFDHLRIVDNRRYPAWFRFRGREYVLRIEPAEAALPGEIGRVRSRGDDEPEDETPCCM